MSFAELLSYISTLTVFIPFLLCLQAIRKKEKFIIALFVLLCTSILTSGLTEYYIQMGSETSLLCLNVYTLFEFTGISIVYALLLPHLKKLIYGTVLLFVAFFIANCYWLESIHTIQDYPLVIESVIVIAYCIAYFFHSLKEVGHDYSVLRDGKFWINIAFVSYFIYSIGLFAIVNHIFTELEPATAQALWNIHNINYIIKNLLLAIGIYRIGKSARPPFELFGADENWWQRLPSNPAKDVSAQP
ncbi:hypothetical protein [Flavisolibacter tropicus]|uniref:Uncharacterized protein n=1 Tax=Flavisolibacter tropicus TaxID=1492898 RepID=A0A172TTZ9_9BACT|nr:hypothetical protein [Flavisolibacter tropicus]ANE50510.1 hypothetical protein SY85_08365 [Flavisolibacter tropicus]